MCPQFAQKILVKHARIALFILMFFGGGEVILIFLSEKFRAFTNRDRT